MTSTRSSEIIDNLNPAELSALRNLLPESSYRKANVKSPKDIETYKSKEQAEFDRQLRKLLSSEKYEAQEHPDDGDIDILVPPGASLSWKPFNPFIIPFQLPNKNKSSDIPISTIGTVNQTPPSPTTPTLIRTTTHSQKPLIVQPVNKVFTEDKGEGRQQVLEGVPPQQMTRVTYNSINKYIIIFFKLYSSLRGVPQKQNLSFWLRITKTDYLVRVGFPTW